MSHAVTAKHRASDAPARSEATARCRAGPTARTFDDPRAELAAQPIRGKCARVGQATKKAYSCGVWSKANRYADTGLLIVAWCSAGIMPR